MGILLAAMAVGTPALAATPDELVLFDPDNGEWHLLSPDGSITTFSFGEPDDLPLWGDWDCDGRDSAAVFRPSDATLTFQEAPDSGGNSFELRVADAVPIAGDWNGNGCDTVSGYRYDRVFIVNQLGGEVDADYYYGVVGDVPVAGDFDGDGVASVGVFRAALGRIFLRNTIETGFADVEYAFGEEGDYVAVGDWNGDGVDTPALYKPGEGAFHLGLEDGPSGVTIVEFGEEDWIPAGGLAGPSPAARARWLLLIIAAATITVVVALAGRNREGAEQTAPTEDPDVL